MPSYKKLQKNITAFRKSRGWKQYHSPKNMVISLLVEIGELAEHFQYLDDTAILTELKKRKVEVGDELVDVLWWVLLMAHDFKIDIGNHFIRKMKKNLLVNKVKGYVQVDVLLPTRIESLSQMTSIINDFRKARGWHSRSHPRDVLLKMFEEVGELAEHVQWKSAAEFEKHLNKNRDAVGDELIDVLICVLLLFHFLKYDIEKEFLRKTEKNARKYPLQS